MTFKIKNKIFILFFIIFLFFPNLSLAVTGSGFQYTSQNTLFEQYFCTYFYNYNSNGFTDKSIPTISDFDSIDELKKYNLYDTHVWVKWDSGVTSHPYKYGYFSLLFLNVEKGQAVFDFNVGSNQYSYLEDLHDLDANYYFLDINRDIFTEIDFHVRSGDSDSLILNLNDEGEIIRIDLFESVQNFVFNASDGSQCGFNTYINGYTSYWYDYTLNSSNTFSWHYNNGSNSSKVFNWYSYLDENLIFLYPNDCINLLNYNAYNYNFLTEKQAFEFNYYFTKDTSWAINSISSTILSNYVNFEVPVLYERNESIISKFISKEESIYIYIDDFNLKKRFQFNINIPIKDEKTKYYLFLNDYIRNDYDNTIAFFKVVTIDLPDNFDSTRLL